MAIVVTLVVIQAVPYGRDHANPDVVNEPAWSSPRTRELVVGACYDCHSNEVVWPWYSNIAPVSWAVSAHVAGGRDAVNFSDFVPGQADGHKSIETIKEGSMPPGYFTAFGLHSDANLSDEEVAELIDGLETTPGLAEEEEGDD
ncbi:MAG: heme-binding domain-containing protein [Actinomycetia bacterium]|nr:heme-binding domain-containing protein [Actinomycetes bacterium]MCP5032161.1 heme-binding domain-containing protein [Actinomycetes bacterium]